MKHEADKPFPFSRLTMMASFSLISYWFLKILMALVLLTSVGGCLARRLAEDLSGPRRLHRETLPVAGHRAAATLHHGDGV